MNIERLEKLLRSSYTKETSHSAFKNRWSRENPTCGQCAITSLIVQNYFGGTANMWFAVIADVGVSIIAIINALRVLKVRKRRLS